MISYPFEHSSTLTYSKKSLSLKFFACKYLCVSDIMSAVCLALPIYRLSAF